jgi:hypothetical protein
MPSGAFSSSGAADFSSRLSNRNRTARHRSKGGRACSLRLYFHLFSSFGQKVVALYELDTPLSRTFALADPRS